MTIELYSCSIVATIAIIQLFCYDFVRNRFGGQRLFNQHDVNKQKKNTVIFYLSPNVW